jgi:2-octaprenylphenol hydroxylase
MSPRIDFDVVIVGGGMVGAALAACLATRQQTRALKVAILEPAPVAPRASSEALDLRVSALSRASVTLLREVAAWPAIEARGVCAYDRMLVWDAASAPDSAQTLVFDAAEIGEATLGTIVENQSIVAALLTQAQRAGVTVFRTAITGLALTPDAAVVTLPDRELRTRLVVAADGAHSTVATLAGFDRTPQDYPQQALIAHLASERWHGGAARQRFLPTGPLALLPLADGRVSLVWSTTPERAVELLGCGDEAFADAVTEASDGVLGRLTLTTARAAWGLRHFNAKRYAATRCVLVGDAAHLVHPLAGQGVNQGFLDVLALADELSRALTHGEDIGDPGVLGRYSRARSTENALVGVTLDGLYRLFTADAAWLKSARAQGLGLVDRLGPIKRWLIAAAQGR